MFIKSVFADGRSPLSTAAILTLASVAAVGQAPTQGTAPCATGSATIAGGSGYSVGSPFSEIVRASTASGCTLTAIRLYADNKTVQTYPINQPGPGTGGKNFQPINLSDGYHNLVGVAWNQDGYAFASPPVSVFITNEDQTVYIPSPANNQTLTDTTVHFDVWARWDGYGGQNVPTQVTHMRLYVDNADIYDSNSTHIDFYKTLTPGQHYAVAVVWDAAGSHIQSSSSFIVK